jgi:hypothetical protein
LAASLAVSGLLWTGLAASVLGAADFSAGADDGFTALLGCVGAAFLTTGFVVDVVGLASAEAAGGFFSVVGFSAVTFRSAGLFGSTGLVAGEGFFVAGAAFFATGLAAGLAAA